MDSLAILLGWPSLGGALLLAAVGIALRKPAFAWTAAALIVPVSLYLAMAPAFTFIGAVPLLCLVAVAATCKRTRRWPGIAALTVYALFLLWLARIALGQPVA